MFGDKLNKLISKNEQVGNNKKKVENLVFFIIVLIITIIAINIIWKDKKSTTKPEENTTSKKLATTENNVQNSEYDLEKKLENILSKIQGVGDVQVFINYSETSEVVAMYNENSKIKNTEEKDETGGIRQIQETDTQKDIVYKELNGEKMPITQKVIQPKIEGAIITAKGAADAIIKTNIIQAVEATTGLATHKIQVFEMN